MLKTANINENDVNTSIEKVSGKEKVSYGLGNLGANLLITTANTFIMFFYTEIGGIAAATVGTILLIARFIDGASDLVMGVVVDKTKSRHGKGRPWMKWLAIPYALAIILLFSAPNFGDTGSIIYAFVTYTFAVGIIYTAVSVPYNSMIGSISRDQKVRGQLSISRTIFGFAGALLINAVTIPLVDLFGGGKMGWQLLAVLYGVIAIVLYIICFRNTKERVQDDVPETNESIPVKEGLKALFKNKYWLMVIGLMLISFTNSGISGVNVYYAQYILGDPALVGAIGVATFLPIIVTALILGPLMKFGNKNLAIVGSILSMIGSLIIIIDAQSVAALFTGIIIRSIGMAPLTIVGFAMLGDTIEYGEWKHGVRTEGLTFSAATFGEKVGTGIGGMLVGAIMGVGGYIGGAAEQSQSALDAIQFVFIYIPIILVIITLVILWFYKLDKEYPQIIEELNERKSNN